MRRVLREVRRGLPLRLPLRLSLHIYLARFVGQLPAPRVDVDAAPHTDGARHAEVREHVDKGARGGHAGGLAGEAARRVERDEVDVRPTLERAEQLPQLTRLLLSVVLARDQRPLEADAPAGDGGVVEARLHQLLQVVPAVDGHDGAARCVGGRVERDGESELQVVRNAVIGELAHHRGNAHRRDGHVPRADAKRADNSRGGLEDVVIVSEGLSHAHEHHVAQPLALARQLAGEGCGLLEDLVGAQVTFEAHLAGRAERAAHRAAHLRRDARCAPVIRIRHQHRLNELPVVQTQQTLSRAVTRLLLVRDAALVHPLTNLLHTVGLLLHTLENLIKRLAVNSHRALAGSDPGARGMHASSDRRPHDGGHGSMEQQVHGVGVVATA
eukprot:scaffold127594_cov69-Phaeocystis_antarctica.AAC.7